MVAGDVAGEQRVLSLDKVIETRPIHLSDNVRSDMPLYAILLEFEYSWQ
jgi:hypothetical protein